MRRRTATTEVDEIGGSRPKPIGDGRPVRAGTWYGRPTDGASARPTIDPGHFGTRVPLPCVAGWPSMRHKPTRDRTGDSTWGVGHGTGNGRSPRGGSREGSRAPLTSRVTGSFGHQARKAAGLAGLIDTGAETSFAPIALRISGGRSSRPGDHGPRRLGGPYAERVARAGAGCVRRGTPLESRSVWTTRAAATSSGSRVTVPATQSMYDGSNAAISPSVCPWNLPNSMTCSRARSSRGGFGRRKLRMRPRSSGPVGVEARGSS